jgi:hypothetical protein
VINPEDEALLAASVALALLVVMETLSAQRKSQQMASFWS